MSKGERKLHARVNKKMDIFIVTALSLLYLLNGLDRGNIGNAETGGYSKDVGMSPTSINNATSLFFITFICFQPVSAALGKRVGARYWIPFLMVCWGAFTIAHAFVKSEGMLIALRLMIGVFEAGFYPCAVYYLSSCYIRWDLARRLALFYGMYAVSGAFSGVIAYYLLQISAGQLRGWQYLFIVEGALTVTFAILAYFWLPQHPNTAFFLNQEERMWAVERISRDSGGKDGFSQTLTKKDLVEAARDWKFWLLLPCNIAASTPSQAFSVFLPIIVEDLGHTSYHANLMSVPIYAIGAIGLYAIAWDSDRKQERGHHIALSLAFVFVGLIMVIEIANAKGRYAGLCVLQIGSYTAPPLVAAWLANNTPEPGKRAIVLGLNGWGNLAGVIGSQLFKPRYGPRYRMPFFVCLGINIFSVAGFFCYRMLLDQVNKRRATQLYEMSEDEIIQERSGDERLGDKNLTFQYSL
ncbi:MFS general substrate transporter [Violaceomyces palustris]|uniref:MFS general substrate transporter n=1 Tax=Violaceomyces palustris TaxID=1673888 RepID=A0ACD0P754_9BASI|nr:MFS general substrate transporter [Violaceomyces palustris]